MIMVPIAPSRMRMRVASSSCSSSVVFVCEETGIRLIVREAKGDHFCQFYRFRVPQSGGFGGKVLGVNLEISHFGPGRLRLGMYFPPHTRQSGDGHDEVARGSTHPVQ